MRPSAGFQAPVMASVVVGRAAPLEVKKTNQKPTLENYNSPQTLCAPGGRLSISPGTALWTQLWPNSVTRSSRCFLFPQSSVPGLKSGFVLMIPELRETVSQGEERTRTEVWGSKQTSILLCTGASNTDLYTPAEGKLGFGRFPSFLTPEGVMV